MALGLLKLVLPQDLTINQIYAYLKIQDRQRTGQKNKAQNWEGDVSALILLVPTVVHTDAASCRVAVTADQRSHVRPIKKVFKYMYVYVHLSEELLFQGKPWETVL